MGAALGLVHSGDEYDGRKIPIVVVVVVDISLPLQGSRAMPYRTDVSYG
jgi:hypothetical protein